VTDGNVFDADFSKGERFFHYTTSSGLIGILQSNCLWATHFRFLNDSKEFYAARSLIEDFIRVEIHKRYTARKLNGKISASSYQLRTVSKQLAEQITSILYDALFDEKVGSIVPYVFSAFCCSPEQAELFSHGGLLHWATYGRGGGYALQINPHILWQKVQKQKRQGYTSRRVIYLSEASRPEALRDQFEELANAIEKIMQSDKVTKENMQPAIAPFFTITSLIKDAYFEQEREARVVLTRLNTPSESDQYYDVHIRPVGGYSVPYIKLFDGELFSEPNAVERIILGPHADNTRRRLALETYFRARDVKVDVSISNVPYVTLPS
jgi:hypothetical protein